MNNLRPDHVAITTHDRVRGSMGGGFIWKQRRVNAAEYHSNAFMSFGRFTMEAPSRQRTRKA